MKKVGLLALALYCGIIYTACGKEDTVYFEPDTQMESEEVTEAVLCPPASCYVYVCGEVVHPGVYEVEDGARIWQTGTAAAEIPTPIMRPCTC